MTFVPATRSLPSRRALLGSIAGIALAGNAFAYRHHEESETVYRFATPECEVQMSVEYYGRSEINSLRFRDFLTRTRMCFAGNGTEDAGCMQQFSGSLAIAHYHFRFPHRAPVSLSLRERVLTIDHDSRLDPRPPFEKLLPIESGVISDIQAFGYDPSSPSTALPLWCLVRQDLYLNSRPSPFLIVHWKHTFDAIRLLDVIPGEQTQLISA
jgi:hypothetical protein